MNGDFFIGSVITFISLLGAEFILTRLLRFFGIYTIVRERQAKVFVLFGKVLDVIDQPGIHFLPGRMGLSAFLVHFLGQVYDRDLSLDQQYLRSNPVNSEEGAPMGIGIWYETYISDPVAHIFKNANPRGSLTANISNATVRCLSNLKLAEMLENRHRMSHTVRAEVVQTSSEWGYQVGSVYIRKVHFRNDQMVKQIEEKVVNRLRQVTAAIRQNGDNQVNIITSTAEKDAAVEFARAEAIRSKIVGEELTNIARDPEVATAVFEILQTQCLNDRDVDLVLLPADSKRDILTALSSV